MTCPLTVKKCRNCMYDCGTCAHPQVSGLSDEQLLDRKAEMLGLEGEKLQQHLDTYCQRIKNALLLDDYAEYVSTNRLRVVAALPYLELLDQVLAPSLLKKLLPHMNVDEGQQLAMCSHKHYARWSKRRGVTQSFEDISGVNSAALLLLRSKMPVG